MSWAYDTYGFGSFPREYVDDAHLLLCPGCHVCQAAEARAERDANRADQHPLATITAGGNHHGVATLTDEGMKFRMLSNRECARAQGFPDDYRFVGTAAEVKKQIGNAVAVGCARWLGERVAAALEDRQEIAA